MVPPYRGWQQAVLAADVVIGDHGAVTGYAAAIGIPTTLATFPRSEVAEGTAISVLGETAVPFDHDRPVPDQLRAAIHDHDPARARQVAELTSSEPEHGFGTGQLDAGRLPAPGVLLFEQRQCLAEREPALGPVVRLVRVIAAASPT